MKTPDIENLNCTNIRNKYISKHYPEFYNFLTDNYKDCKTLSEKLYLYYNGLDKRPICKICGSEVGFISFFKGFNNYCNIKCSRKDPESNLKRMQTNLERYGVENVSQNESIKEKKKQTTLKHYGVINPMLDEYIKERVKQTNLKRYGAEYVAQSESIKERAKQTNLERYGYISSAQNEIVKDKVRYTCLERYGVENVSQNDDIKEKIKTTHQNINTETHPDLLRYTEDGNWVCKCPHIECNKCIEKEYITTAKLYYDRKQIGSELCTKLLPIQPSYSTPELQIRNFLDSLNIEYITNDRSIISPKELDIYIPSKKIAIEFNGSYWHSDIKKDKYYHQNKTIACYSKGILLVHIYEYEWNANKEIILERLKKILNGKEVDDVVSVKDYNKYTLSEPVLIDYGSYKIWNEGEWILKENL